MTNTGDSPATGIVVATIDGRNDLQNARRVTVEPKSTKSTNIYLHIPQSVAGKDLVEIEATLYIEDGNREVVQTINGRPARKTLSLGLDPQPTLAAFILDPKSAVQPYWFWPPNPPSTSYELAVASRVDADNNRYSANYEDRSLPISRLDWEVLGTVVLGEQATLDDAVFVESLKQFMAGGGKLWILLDRISSESIRPLLGANQICETVDEVEFNEFTVDVIGAVNPIGEADRKVKSFKPLKMKRVIQHGGRVTHEVDGWPAAIWMPMGYGEMLITTLDCAAWIRQPDDPSSRPGTDSPFYAAFQSTLWANQLAIDINDPSLNQPLAEAIDYPWD